MSQLAADINILTVLGERLVDYRLPRLEQLKARLDQGDVLSDYDIWFLKEALSDAQGNKALIERHPEVQEIVGSVLHLYKEIMDLALANEQKLQQAPAAG